MEEEMRREQQQPRGVGNVQEIPAWEAPQVLNLDDCGAPASWDFHGAVRGANNACGHTLPPSAGWLCIPQGNRGHLSKRAPKRGAR